MNPAVGGAARWPNRSVYVCMAGYVGSPPAMTADQWEYMRASGMGGSDPQQQQQQQVIHVRPEKLLWGSMVHHRAAVHVDLASK